VPDPLMSNPSTKSINGNLSTFSTGWTLDGASYGLLDPASDTLRLRFPSDEERAAQNLHADSESTQYKLNAI
jgi:hypothetical protein